MKPIEIMEKAQIGGYAIGQFNISTDEQITAVVEVAKELNAPVIIGTSEGEREFIGVDQAVALVKSWQKETGLPIKTIIGGAPVTQDYADKIGADGYAADAATAVDVAKKILGIENI